MTLYYFAHPYTGNEEENYAKCLERTALLMRRGCIIYSPILSSHPLDKTLKWNHEKWLEYDTIFMRKCNALILVKGEWEQSKGCKMEFEHFKGRNKMITEFDFVEKRSKRLN